MRWKSLVLALVMFFSAIPANMATAVTKEEKNTLYFTENFDSARGGLVKSLEFGPQNNEITVMKKDTNPNDQYVRITMKSTDSAKKEAQIVKRFTGSLPGGNMVLDVSLMVEDLGGCSPRVAMRSPNGGGSEIYPIEITQSGQVLGVGGVELLSSMVEGKFYKFSLAFDFNKGTYDVFINGLRKAQNISFQNQLAYSFKTVSLILFNTRNTTAGCKTKYSIDDIKIYNSEKPLSEKKFNQTDWNLKLNYDSRVSTDMVKYGMQNNIVLYVGAGKALLNGVAKPIDPENENVSPFIVDGTTLVPARFITEALSGSISYDANTQSATANLGGKKVVITANEKYMLVDGKKQELATAAVVKDGRFFIPLRAMGELAGKEVFWDKTGMIILSDEAINLNWRDNTSYLSAIAGEMVYQRPSGADVISAMKKNFPNNSHPRILIDSTTFDRVKEEIKNNPIKKSWYADIKAEADNCLKRKVVEFPENVKQLVDQGVLLQDMAPCLALVYHIEGDMKYAQRLIDEVQAWVDHEFWTPYSMLGLGRAAVGFAIAYDWLYDVMPEKLKTDLKKAISERFYTEVFKDYYNIYPRSRSFEWTLAIVGDNWNTTINSGVIMTALAFGDEPGYEEECSQLITEAIISLEAAFNQLAPDGSWYEGVGYWTPTTKTMVWAMETLRNATGTDYGLFNVPGMQYAGYYLYEMSATTGIFNFNFAAQRGYPCPELIYFANRLGDYSLKQLCIDHYEKFRGEASIYMTADALIYSGDLPDEKIAVNLPLDAYYRGTEAISMRSSWEPSKEFYVGFHSGFNGAPNAQLDIGTFVVEAFGERFITDFGPENYDLTPRIFEAYMNRAEGANCYIINPSTDYMDQLKSAYCYFDRYETNEISALAITDMTAAYGKKVESAVRGMKMTNNRTAVILQDEIKCPEPSDIYWGMHTPAKVTLSEDKKTALLNIRGNKMEVKIMSEQGEWSLDKAEPLPECFQLAGQTKHSGTTKLAMRFKDATDVNVAICFTPLGYAADVEIKYPKIQKLADWTLDTPGEVEQTIVPDMGSVVLTDLRVNGETIKGFNQRDAVFNYTIESRTAPMPVVEAISEYKTEVVYPDKWPGNIKIKLIADHGIIEKEIKIMAPPETPYDYTHKELKVKNYYVDSLTQEDAPPENSLDHNFGTRLALGVPNFVVYDFGDIQSIEKIILSFYSGNRRQTYFDIEISNDNQNWTQVFSGESGGKTLNYEYFDIGNQQARYLKIIGKGTSTKEEWLSITEFRAFGAK